MEASCPKSDPSSEIIRSITGALLIQLVTLALTASEISAMTVGLLTGVHLELLATCMCALCWCHV